MHKTFVNNGIFTISTSVGFLNHQKYRLFFFNDYFMSGCLINCFRWGLVCPLFQQNYSLLMHTVDDLRWCLKAGIESDVCVQFVEGQGCVSYMLDGAVRWKKFVGDRCWWFCISTKDDLTCLLCIHGTGVYIYIYMVYLPTSSVNLSQMWVNIPYMEHMADWNPRRMQPCETVWSLARDWSTWWIQGEEMG